MSNLVEDVKNRVQSTIPLAPFTTFHLGGPAEFFFQAETEEELVLAVEMAHREGRPFFLLGGGSNLVIADQGMSGLVIRNNARDRLRIDPDKGILQASSGLPLATVVEAACQAGLTGMEPFTGIPGSLGGAIYGNAGAYGKCIADLLIDSELLAHDGRLIQAKNAFFEFQYRTSALKTTPFVVLNATFKLARGTPEQIRIQMNDILTQRHSKHPPMHVGSAGSFFKNLDPNPGETRRRPAGEVLEKAGAKQMTVGGASVYAKHANFIVNYGEATAGDVKALAARMKESVMSMFGIELHEEVLYLGH
jgi:UDP-N-acetylmuramate dehydrogenase